MIDLGDRWGAEERTVFHACTPGVRTAWLGEESACACGAAVPRRVRNFRAWLIEVDDSDLESCRGDRDPGDD